MPKVREFFAKVFVLVRWPILSLLLLQITLAFLFSDFSLSNLVISSGVLLFILALHLAKKSYPQMAVLLIVVSISFGWWLAAQNPLSQNITPKAATYQGLIQNTLALKQDVSRYQVALQERLDPVKDAVAGSIQLSIAGHCQLPEGSTVVFNSPIKKVTHYQNPGVFSFRKHIERQNMWAGAFAESCDQVQILSTPALGGISGMKAELLQNFQNPEIKNSGILSALLLGTKTIDRPEYEKIQMSGLSHLFVISGLHFGIMSLLVFGVFVFIFNFFPKLFLYWPRQKFVSAATLAFVLFYMVLINPSPSVLRAGSMIAFYLLAKIFEKQKNLLHVVLLSMAVVLFFNPMDLFSVGFQLSYLSVLALIVVLPKPLEWLQNRKWLQKQSRAKQLIVKMVFVTWSLNLILLPMVLYTFGSVSLNGFVQNLWAIPFFEFLVIPVGLFYLLTALLGLSMAPYILYFWDGTIQLFWLLQGYFAKWSLPEIDSVTPHAIHLLVLYLGLFLFFRFSKKWILPAMTLMLVATLSFTYYQNHLGYDMRITHLDVGQGDAILVQTPEKNVLIDTGGHPYFKLGESVVLPALKHLWVTKLDHVIITHGDVDHYQSLKSLIGKVAIGEVWINDLKPEDENYKSVLDQLAENQIPIQVKNKKEVLKWNDGTQVKVLSPNENVAKLQNKNDHSLVVKIEKDNFSALFTGDISEAAEKVLVEEYQDELKSDYLKVPHHGSSTSTSRLLLGFVKPKYVSIGVKEDSPFGHPTDEVLDKLKEYNAKILRTDQDGQIQVSLKNKEIHVKTFAK